METKNHCETCAYWSKLEPSEPQDAPDDGECRYTAPSLIDFQKVSDVAIATVGWPKVSADKWCGAHSTGQPGTPKRR